MHSDGWIIAQSIANIALVVVTIPGIIIALIQLRAGAEAAKLSAQEVANSAAASQAAANHAEVAANAAKASAIGLIANAGRDIQWYILEHPGIQSLIVENLPTTGLTDIQKQDVIRGMTIAYYAFVFEFYRLGQIPETAWSAFRADMSGFFRKDPNITRWEKIRPQLSREFQKFIQEDIRHLP